MQQNYLSYRVTAAKFNIPSQKMITDWEKSYNESGIHAFASKRGRYSKVMKKTVSKQPALKPDKQKTTEELLDEIEYLRAEVAYLKKLDALIQERKLNAPKTKRKL